MHLRRPALAGALALLMAGAATNAASASPDHKSGLNPVANPSATETVTLVTGDRVVVQAGPDGRTAFTIEEADRDGDVSFETLTYGDETYIIPSDAAPLVPEVLDRELFNVTKLAEYDYHESVPVIVSYEPKAARTLAAPRGARVTAQLPSINAVAATIDRNGQWWRSAQPSGAAGAKSLAGTGTLAGVDKVWLDGLATVELSESVRQIGAPEAWAAGYDGAGVTVAVLDTGIDVDHPDLKGRVLATQDFTDSGGPRDWHGHGTHVATTIAGTGAASGGKYTGVAPKAQLLAGKVCAQEGCPFSAIMLGMQWAAIQGADVVNMSLGGGFTDGTDPLSQTVNALTEQYGTLFVIAAGNSGQYGEGTVEAPGTADAALTVGAVDKADQLAYFSGYGPRAGDYAIKPDLTAPGVGIVAGRASGTGMGSPVNDYYTAASGTSMATPHVAGAAALFLQQNPGLSPAEVKAALASTAVPNGDLEVYQQGGGRLDMRNAVNSPVLPDRSPLSLGYFAYPQGDTAPVNTTVSYTNRSTETVTIDLALDVKNREGTAASADMLTVSPASLIIKPGGTAKATVTLDVRVGAEGIYGGYLTASRNGGAVNHIPVGYYKEGVRYELRVKGIDRNGQPANALGMIDVLDVKDTRRFIEIDNRFDDGTVTLRVPPGTYSVAGYIYTPNKQQGALPERTWVGDPEIKIDADTTLVFDARQAAPVRIVTPEPATPTGVAVLGWWRETESGWPFAHNIHASPSLVSATPTAPVTRGDFELYTRQRLVAGPQNSILYDLVVPFHGQVPADPAFVADPARLARVNNRYHSDVTGQTMLELRHFYRPWSLASSQVATMHAAPQERVEYLVAEENCYAQWMYGALAYIGELREPTTCYKPGERRDQSWFRQVARPGFNAGSELEPGVPTTRDGDLLTLFAYEWLDSDGHYGMADSGVDTTAIRVYENGRLLGQGPRAQGTITVSPDRAEHRIELDVARKAAWWTTSTETHTAWTLQSKGSTSGPVVLPLLQVDYNVPVDLRNTTAQPNDRKGPLTLGLTVGHQAGADSPAIRGAKVSISYDDGKTWQKRPVRDLDGGRFEVTLDNRDPAETNGFVALRVEAWDADNNRIEQTVIRAWQLPPAR
ncbi:S8 family peptidase [Micromonospora eburnea]|uniref:Serine protease, subtilisin family n=1 Tax=Micromonospora eburnea TaxID=227316 RepID=A0A1C6UG58_9ACTN|nr:S8 family serine peptidase [Micromonospora eburnea]SCL53017.1 Serine protease, subtilisin family [Micromonospora eburnea]